MLRNIARVGLLALLVGLGGSVSSAGAAPCTYVLGFAAIHDMIPDKVGDCLVDEHHNPINGDGLQETAGVDGKGGLLVWRKSDNWTAYTDGYRTWVNGPNGLQQRLNTQRFPFEHDPIATPTPSSSSALAFVSLIGGRPGQIASTTIQVIPGLSCSLAYQTPAGTASVAQGLGTAIADASGKISWSWVIGPNTTPGTGTVTVTCGGISLSAPITIG